MRVPINTENDLSMGLGTHNLWLPPIIPTPIPGPASAMAAAPLFNKAASL